MFSKGGARNDVCLLSHRCVTAWVNVTVMPPTLRRTVTRLATAAVSTAVQLTLLLTQVTNISVFSFVQTVCSRTRPWYYSATVFHNSQSNYYC